MGIALQRANEPPLLPAGDITHAAVPARTAIAGVAVMMIAHDSPPVFRKAVCHGCVHLGGRCKIARPESGFWQLRFTLDQAECSL